MRWFEAEPMNEGPRRAKFANVSKPRTRAPSWLPQARGKPAAREDSPSLSPPRVPSEFVDAIRRELEPERASRAPRASEIPPAARAPSLLPPPMPAQAEAVTETRIVVDPAATAAFEHAVELLISERSRVIEQTASQLGELATIIARRVIAHELSVNPGLVAGLVREGLAALGAHDRVVVRVGRLFSDACENLEKRLADRGAHAEVRVDPTLADHGCVIETELGHVDESIESRIATLLNALKPDSAHPTERDSSDLENSDRDPERRPLRP
jgi:hypothetical protein